MYDQESDGPTLADIALCASVMQRMQPADLTLPLYAAILEAGVPLFKRHICKDKFGSTEAVEFLKEKMRVSEMTAKLEKYHAIVVDVHEERRKKAESCGMNVRRKADLEKIIADSSRPEASECAISDVGAIGGTMPVADVSVGVVKSASPGIDVTQCREARRFNDAAFSGAAVADMESVSRIRRDDLYSACNMCRGEYTEQHHFYHQLCPGCAELNWQKRGQSADMSGMVCVVTGGRVRIGFAIVLKLLRAGAFVLTTTRYPNDCIQRYTREKDYEIWRHRLEVCGPVELCDLRLVEAFCDELLLRFPRIHVLINNAAQTLSRPMGWQERMAQLEAEAAAALPPRAKALLRPLVHIGEVNTRTQGLPPPMPKLSVQDGTAKEDARWNEAVEQLKDFPEGLVDESRQPLDLSASNSWSRRVGDVSTIELLQTLAANTAAPFIMLSRLASVLAPQGDEDPFGHVINVSALEGKFSVRNKSSSHPHTNMAKAALNMLTHTSAKDMFQRRILMNCVDTGWVTDMAPGGVGAVAAAKATWVAPPLDEEDGAARVLDPVFSHLRDQAWLVRGKFFKNYFVCQW
mmetsp:Transcript_88420/g.253267  ORF Transcript_88420/g.253267 Transcript_88420/m.253267 type:complete len:577 (+) Transcript_88420:97-1827(+)